jgi:hypothetical protein
MNAREMFGALGYECSKSDIKIEYSWGVENIVFWVNEHEFFARDCVCDTKCITVDEFKAIQQQMKELGWI